MASTRNRATGSTKRSLRAHAIARQPVIVVVEERPIDASAYGISEAEAERGSTLNLYIKHPNARAIIDRIGSTGGSYWELADAGFAYNMVDVWSDKERKAVLTELKRDGLYVTFSDADYIPRAWIKSRGGLRKSSTIGLKRQQRLLTRANLKRRKRY